MQTSNLAALTQNSLLAARFGATDDSWRWGIVTALNPVTVRLDGETSPIFPSDVLSNVTVGDRVFVRISGMSATIMGSDGSLHQPVQVDVDTQRVVRPGVYPDGRLDPPAGLSGVCRSGMVSITWSGKLSRLGGVPYLPPANFDHIVLQQSDKKTGDWADIGMCTSGGLTLDRQNKVGSSLWFRGAAVDIKGKRYETSQPFEVVISNQLASDVANALHSAEQAGKVAAESQETLTSKLGEFQTALDGYTGKIDTAVRDASVLHNEMVSLRQDLGKAHKRNLLEGIPWVDGWGWSQEITREQDAGGGADYLDFTPGSEPPEGQVMIWTKNPVIKAGRIYEVFFSNRDYSPYTVPGACVYPFYCDIVDDKPAGMFAPEDPPHVENGETQYADGFSWILDLRGDSDGTKLYHFGFTSEESAVTYLAPPVLCDVTEEIGLRKKIDDAQSKAEEAYTAAESKTSPDQVREIVVQSAAGNRQIVYGNTKPDKSGKTVGDTWFARDTSGHIWGQWVWDGTQWQPALIDSQVVANLDVGKLTAGTVVTPEAVIEKLWTDGLNSKVVKTQKVVVSPGNLWTDTDFSAPDQSTRVLMEKKYMEVGDFYGRRSLHCIVSATTANKRWRYGLPAPFSLGLISSLVLECEVLTTSEVKPELRFDVVYSTDGKPSSLSMGSSVGEYVDKIEPYVWCRVRCEIPHLDPAYSLGFLSIRVAHSENVYISNVTVRAKNGTVLIEDGSVTAGKIVVDKGLVDKLTVSSSLWAGKISTEMLKVGDYVNGVAIDKYGVHVRGKGTVELDAGGFIARDRDGVPTVRIGTDGDAEFKGSIRAGSTISSPQITGGIITGARLQTSQTGQRTVVWKDRLEQYDSGGKLFARIAGEEISFWKDGNQIGRFDRGYYDSDYGTNYGVGITLERPGQYIALGTHESGAHTIESKIWVDWSSVTIEGTRWADVRDAAFTGRNAMSHADAAMNQANRAIAAVNDLQRRLVSLWTSAGNVFSALNAYGITTASGGTVGPGNFPSPIW